MNRTTPLVSIIIPTYGRTDFLEDAIYSAQNQTYKNIEIIVCDDNANNPVIRKRVADIVKKYPRCKLIQNSTNLGGSFNRNEGVKVAKGDLISFLDDDDTYEPTRIEKVVNSYLSYEGDRIGLIYTWNTFVDINHVRIGEDKRDIPENALFAQMCGCICSTSLWTVPRYVFDEVGMFEDAPCKQDSIMLLKILGANFKLLLVKECLTNYRTYFNNKISANYEAHIVGEQLYFDWCKKFYDKISIEQQRIVEMSFKEQLMINLSGTNRWLKAWSEWISLYQMGFEKNKLISYIPYLLLGYDRILRAKDKCRSLLKRDYCFNR